MIHHYRLRYLQVVVILTLVQQPIHSKSHTIWNHGIQSAFCINIQTPTTTKQIPTTSQQQHPSFLIHPNRPTTSLFSKTKKIPELKTLVNDPHEYDEVTKAFEEIAEEIAKHDDDVLYPNNVDNLEGRDMSLFEREVQQQNYQEEEEEESIEDRSSRTFCSSEKEIGGGETSSSSSSSSPTFPKNTPLYTSTYTQILSTNSLQPIASKLRQLYDDHFDDPRQPNSQRFVWDPWFVSVGDARRTTTTADDTTTTEEENDMRDPPIQGERTTTSSQIQYSLKRIQTSQFFSSASTYYNDLINDLVDLGRSIGLKGVTPPWTSMYTNGDGQNFHTDTMHGPMAFVLSLCLEDGGFEGGETMLLQSHVLDFWRMDGGGAKMALECGDIIRYTVVCFCVCFFLFMFGSVVCAFADVFCRQERECVYHYVHTSCCTIQKINRKSITTIALFTYIHYLCFSLEYLKQKNTHKRYIPPTPLGRCIAFDPRVPHGVNVVRGGNDPRKARVVVHGWFKEPDYCWFGPWGDDDEEEEEEDYNDNNYNDDDNNEKGNSNIQDARDRLEAKIQPLVEVLAGGGEEEGIGRVMGYLAVRLNVTPEGTVSNVVAVCDTLQADRDDYKGIIGYDESNRPVMEDSTSDVRLMIYETLKDLTFRSVTTTSSSATSLGEDEEDRAVVIPFMFE